MSRRSHANRRRIYGRRQHEIRERRPGRAAGSWPSDVGNVDDSSVGRLDDGQRRNSARPDSFGAKGG